MRGGGHGFSGSAVCDGGLMIDLSALNAVPVDPERAERRLGRRGLGDLDAATQEHGLAVPAGIISHTGVGGLTLGGGMGWLTGRAGPDHRQPGVGRGRARPTGASCGRRAEEHPDLFWALRGGGGNFGVVTEFEFRLHPVGPIVHARAAVLGARPRAASAPGGARRSCNGLPATSAALIAVR